MTQAFNSSAPTTDQQRAPQGFKVWRPGLMAYRDAQTRQEELIEQRPLWPLDLLILLEHPTVITLGRSNGAENLRCSHDVLESAGIDCIPSRRGGDITLHNPGQLVGYPIVDLNHYRRDLHRFLRLLEEVLIRTLADYSLVGAVVAGKTGVWIEDRKIASIGIAVRRWISYHGFALNIDNDLTAFDAIIPCGLPDVTMTSMSKELGRPLDGNGVAAALTGHFGDVLERAHLGNYDDIPTTTQT